MKKQNNNLSEKQVKSEKRKESNPVIMNGDSNMRKPVRGLSK